MLDHENETRNDRRCNHLNIRYAVCRIPNRDPQEFSPIEPPLHRQTPEQRAMHQIKPYHPPTSDYTDRWVLLMEKAFLLMVCYNCTHDMEKALQLLTL